MKETLRCTNDQLQSYSQGARHSLEALLLLVMATIAGDPGRQHGLAGAKLNKLSAVEYDHLPSFLLFVAMLVRRQRSSAGQSGILLALSALVLAGLASLADKDLLRWSLIG